MDPVSNYYFSRTHDHLEKAMIMAKNTLEEARRQGNDIEAERERLRLKYYLAMIEAVNTVDRALRLLNRHRGDQA